MADFQFPNFNTPGFPYQNLVQQLAASMQNPTPGSYARWGGTGLLGSTPMPGAVAGPGGTYPMPKAPEFIGMNKFPVGGLFDPVSQVSGVTSVGPSTKDAGNLKMATDDSGQNFGAPPAIPVGGSNQAFSSNFMPTAANVTSAEELHYLQARPNSLHAQRLAAMPTSFSPAQFNTVAQVDPTLAVAMAGQMGQAGRNAIMANDGLSNSQFNSFINGYGSGAMPGFGPEQMALLRAMGIA